MTRRNSAGARRQRSPQAPSSAGCKAAWSGGRARSGHRSILCDPRRADMKSILNAKIKRRKSFGPFAPSVLGDAAAQWFEEGDDVPFMSRCSRSSRSPRARFPPSPTSTARPAADRRIATPTRAFIA